MGNFIDSAHNFIMAHQKGFRLGCLVVATGSAIATPFLVSTAKDRVEKKIKETGATTKKEKIKIAREDPFVWAACATTLTSIGCGALTYGISEKVISTTNKTIEMMVDKIEVTEESISETLSEKDQEKLGKKVAEKTMNKASERADVINSTRGLGTAGAPIDTGFGTTLFFDVWSNTWFLSDYQKIISIMNSINEEINTNGTAKTAADWLIANGIPPKELDYDYFFRSNIKLLKDSDHFYSADDKGNPVGLIEFTYDSKPKHLTKAEQSGLPFI